MKKNIKCLRALQNWFETPLGVRVGKAFAQELLNFQALKGEYLLQLGVGGEESWLTSLAYKHQWLASPIINTHVDVPCMFHSLPFDTHSIDCVVAPIVLQGFVDVEAILDEIARVLKSTGLFIMFGIQPLSFWGLSQYFGRHRCFGNAKVSLHPAMLMRNKLEHRSFQQCAFSTFYYIPPIQSQTMAAKLQFLNEMGKMACLFPAGFYCLIMQKYEIVSPNQIVLEKETEPVELLNGMSGTSSARS